MRGAHTEARHAIESAPRELLEVLQRERLRTTLVRLGRDMPIRSLDDVRALPFTTKDDLRDGYPLGAMAVAPRQLLRVHSSSGTSGHPTLVGHTRADLTAWADIMARSLAAAGVVPGAVLHNGYPYGLTTGGFGFQQGAERLGATVVPAAGTPFELQASLIADLGASVLCCPPSHAAQLARVLPRENPLEIGIFGGEMWSDALRARVEAELGLVALDSYGLSELIGPGVAQECLHGHDGAHINEDHFLAEVIDPATGEPVSPGELGELVITTLTREAMPLIRYRTGDTTSVTTEPCACGRTTARMRRVLGRRRDLIAAGDALFYPSMAEQVLLEHRGLGLNYQLVLEPGEALTVRCEARDVNADRFALGDQVQAALRDRLGLRTGVVVEPPGSLPVAPAKAVRVVDHR